MKRLFIAIDISDEARRAVAALIGELRHSFPRVKASWVREENLHITVKFLGETPESGIDAMIAALGDAAMEIPAFDIQLSGPGSFGTRVLIIGVSDEDEGFNLVHQRVEAALGPLGLEREKRAFHPHITIARIRDPRGTTELIMAHNAAELPQLGMIAGGLTLYESEMRPGGSKYTPLERFPFSP